jgi:tetratricopeptide (TPR) repeat protein
VVAAGTAERRAGGPSLIERATALELEADRHPSEVAAEAEALVVEADRAREFVAAATAARALGVARRDGGDLAGAAEAFAAALRAARRAGDAGLAGRVRISLTGLHIVAGDLAAARAEAARAAPLLAAVDRARLEMQMAVAEERAGLLAEAVARYDAAAPVLAAAGDELWSARLRLNRSVALAQLGRLDEATRDLEAGATQFEQADNAVAVTIALNRAWLAGLAADVPLALLRYDDAAAVATRVGLGVGLVERDRAELLAQVGLWDEAVVAAGRAVTALTSSNPLDASEALIVLATALAGAERLDDARAAALQAEHEFLDQGRPVWASRATVSRVSAMLHAAPPGRPGAAALTDALGAAGRLAAAGFAADAAEARALTARAAVATGVPVPAGALPLVPASGPPWTRARLWHAEAARRLAEGDRRGASRAAVAGLDAVAPLRRALGSLELRAGVGATVAAIADLGVALAAERGPRPLLAWAERRAGTTGLRPEVPDTGLRAALAALRAAASEAAGGEEGPRAALAARRLRDAEAEVRRLDRHGRSTAQDPSGPAMEAVLERLDGRTLLRYAVAGSDVWLVVVAGRRARSRRLGPVDSFVARVDRLRFALGRLARGGSAAERARSALTAAADELARVLVPSRLGAGPVVVVPDGPLHGVAWMALRPLAGRSVSVAPSVGAWMAAQARRWPAAPAPSDLALFAAGPGLAGAEAEVAAAARAWGAGAVLLGPGAAHVVAVLEALGSARLGHLACHGRFRGDSPLFSSLTLADGPLTVHDLLGLARAPEVLVLGACDVGESVAVAGSEVLGLAAGCLTAGAASVVASVLPLPDGAAAPVLADVVARIVGGAGAGPALAEAAAAARAGDATAQAVAASLCCFGAG